MTKEQEKELSKVFPLIDDRDFDYHAKIIKTFIDNLLKKERERILKALPKQMEWENSARVQIADGYNQYRSELLDIIKKT